MEEHSKVHNIKFKKTLDKTVSRYVVNGVEYKSLDEIPVEFRQKFEGIQNQIADDSREFSNSQDSQIFEINGQVYHSLDEVPPELREFLESEIRETSMMAFDAEENDGQYTASNVAPLPASANAMKDKQYRTRWTRPSSSYSVLFFAFGVIFTVLIMLLIILGYILYKNL